MSGHPDAPSAADLIARWKGLASGDSNRARQLGDACAALIQRRGLDVAGNVYGIIQSHKNDLVRAQIRRETGAEWNLLRDDARRLVARLETALQDVETFHRRCARHKWYQPRPRVCDVEGRLVQPPQNGQDWVSCRVAYAKALASLKCDPAFTFLLDLKPLEGRGNPSKRRNKSIRADLNELGLTRAEIATILSGLDFTKLLPPRRPDGR